MDNQIFKVTPAQLGYEIEDGNGKSLQDILRTHEKDICIIIHGSSYNNVTDKKSHYEAVMVYNNISMTIKGELNNESANQAMIKGFTECAKHITKPMKVCVITATRLGFEKAFNGKGVNCTLIEEFYEELYSKKCAFTEIKYLYMAEDIKTFLRKVLKSHSKLSILNFI